MNYIFIIIAILYNCQYLIKTQVDFGCSPQYCFSYGNCPKFSCKGPNMKTIYNATKCGCCNKCVKELNDNEECQPEMTGNTPGTQCGPHLTCYQDKTLGKSFCKPLSQTQKDGECEKKRFDLISRPSELTTGQPIPECDEFGDYAAKQCKNGTLCHCVDKKGDRIFGTTTYDNSKDMDCLCSRQFDEVNRQLKSITKLQTSIDPVFFLRCKANGNYHRFQSVGNLTYCVNTTSGELHERPVHKKDVDQLSCHNERYPYMSDCMDKYEKENKKIKEIEEEEESKERRNLVVGYDVPKCDIDGTYAPVQCLNNNCYCVNKKGEKYKGTQVGRNTKEAMNQNCTCVRELEMIRDINDKNRDKVTVLFSHYKCDKNGNYLPLQCSESACYCVNPIDGFQSSESVLKTDGSIKSKLNECCNNRFDEIYVNQF